MSHYGPGEVNVAIQVEDAKLLAKRATITFPQEDLCGRQKNRGTYDQPPPLPGGEGEGPQNLLFGSFWQILLYRKVTFRDRGQ